MNHEIHETHEIFDLTAPQRSQRLFATKGAGDFMAECLHLLLRRNGQRLVFGDQRIFAHGIFVLPAVGHGRNPAIAFTISQFPPPSSLVRTVFNQAVKRNADRFPADFIFQLTAPEFENLKLQIADSSWSAATDQGATASPTILRCGHKL